MKSSTIVFLSCQSLAFPALTAYGSAVQDTDFQMTRFKLLQNDAVDMLGERVTVKTTLEVSLKESAGGYVLFEADAMLIVHGSAVHLVTNADCICLEPVPQVVGKRSVMTAFDTCTPKQRG